MKKEQKIFSLKLNELTESGQFTGYASTFGNVDLGNDIVDAGAFKKTIKESKGKIPILDHHDPERQIGWNIDAVEDERGLLVTGKLNLDVQRARERHSLMKQAQEIGAETGLSIGYQTIKSEPDKETPSVRRLKELRLLEYSVVVFPMNPAAGIETVKERRLDTGDGRQEKIEPHTSGLPFSVSSLQSPVSISKWEPVIHSLVNLKNQIKTINKEYSQWK